MTVREPPNAYDLFIHLEPLTRLWREDSLWSHRPVVVCTFHAMELGLRMLGDALGDRRSALLRDRWIDRLLGHLSEQFQLTAWLLEGAELPMMEARWEPGAALSPGLEVLGRLAPPRARRAMEDFLFHFRQLSFRTGLEEQLGELCERLGLPASPEDGRPALDYERLVRPREVMAAGEARYESHEAHLFPTVHQIVECWFHLVHLFLAEGTRLAREGRFLEAAECLDKSSRCVELGTRTGQLLDAMTPADFHPLRVKLRDASGALSRAVQQLPTKARAALEPLLVTLERQGLPLVHVIDRPHEHLDLYRYVEALKQLSKQSQNFLFQHYLLTLSIFGTLSFGSFGYRIESMVGRAAEPLFAQVNQAHHDLMMIANFRYGKDSGKVTMHNDIAAGYNPYQPALPTLELDPLHIRERIRDYFRFIHERNAEAWVDLYDPNSGLFCDSPGTKPFVGPRKLRIFIHAMFDAFKAMDTHFWDVSIQANQAHVHWRFETTSYNDKRIVFSGVERFIFGGDGKILSALAEWDPGTVADQLWPTRSPALLAATG